MKSFFNWLKDFAFQLMVLTVLFGVINGVLWLIQSLPNESSKKIESLEIEVSIMDKNISDCKYEVEDYNRIANNGYLEENIYKLYESKIERCNHLVEERNLKTDELNELHKNQRGKFYLIPIPLGRKNHS